MSFSGRIPLILMVLATTLLLSTQNVSASQQDLQCPAGIAPESLHVDTGAGEWMAFVPRALPLTAAGFAEGEPVMRASLKPASTEKRADGSQVKWVFEGAYPHGKWLVCDYANGVAMYSRRIADDTTVCVVSYRRGKQGAQNISRIRCE